MKKIFSIEPPQKTNSTYGNWICLLIIGIPFGDRKTNCSQYFFKKNKAIEFYNNAIRSINSIGYFEY